MSMYNQFETDPDLERKGIIIDYSDFRVTVSRSGGSNKRYSRILEAKTKPYRRAIQTETISPELQEQILMEVTAEALVMNWEVPNGEDKNGLKKWKQGIEARDGTTLPFTPDNVLATFKALPDIFWDVQEGAGKSALYRKHILEDEAKN